MEHEEAIRIQAAEKYVARELSPAERRAFEEHYFDCPECADDVRFEQTFAANVRAASRAVPPLPAVAPPQPAPWFRLRPALLFSVGGNLALAACCVFFVVTRSVLPSLEPQFAAAYFSPGPAKGADEVHDIPAASLFYAVRFPFEANVNSYFFVILDAAGKRESSAAVAAPANPSDETYLEVPVKNLPAGVHTLEVYAGGANGQMVSRSRFRR